MDTAGKNEFKGTVTVGIDKDGVISFNGKAVTEDQLEGLLDDVHNIDKDIPVLIKADETSQLKKLTFVEDACRKAGLNKFQPPEPLGPSGLMYTRHHRSHQGCLGRALAGMVHRPRAHGRRLRPAAGQEIFDLRMRPSGAPPLRGGGRDPDSGQGRYSGPSGCWVHRPCAPDILINNAGLIGTIRRPLWEVPAEEFAQVMAVNDAWASPTSSAPSFPRWWSASKGT